LETNSKTHAANQETHLTSSLPQLLAEPARRSSLRLAADLLHRFEYTLVVELRERRIIRGNEEESEDQVDNALFEGLSAIFINILSVHEDSKKLTFKHINALLIQNHSVFVLISAKIHRFIFLGQGFRFTRRWDAQVLSCEWRPLLPITVQMCYNSS
jgi:hypothetical protein